MRLAYLILAHTNPHQLERLVSRLKDERNDIFIHLDSKVEDDQSFLRIAATHKNVFFTSKRYDVRWGAYSMIKATLDSLEEIIEYKEYDYISLISGMDYPVKTNEEIYNFFLRNNGKEFLYYRKSPSPELPLGGCDRFEYYYDYDSRVSNRNEYESEMLLRQIKRPFLKGMAPYHGSQWWSLTGKCVSYIANTVKNNIEIENFYRYTKFPDEHFFQTIIMNSSYSANTINNNLRYIDWSDIDWTTIDWKVTMPHPKLLTINDFEKIRVSQTAFARKFDERVDSRVLDTIDVLLLKKDPGGLY